MDGEIIKDGLELMAVGMGVVFSFLVLLVVFMTASGAFFQKYSHLFAEPPQQDAPAAKSSGAEEKAKVAVAIAAAHRTKYQ